MLWKINKLCIVVNDTWPQSKIDWISRLCAKTSIASYYPPIWQGTALLMSVWPSDICWQRSASLLAMYCYHCLSTTPTGFPLTTYYFFACNALLSLFFSVTQFLIVFHRQRVATIMHVSAKIWHIRKKKTWKPSNLMYCIMYYN